MMQEEPDSDLLQTLSSSTSIMSAELEKIDSKDISLEDASTPSVIGEMTGQLEDEDLLDEPVLLTSSSKNTPIHEGFGKSNGFLSSSEDRMNLENVNLSESHSSFSDLGVSAQTDVLSVDCSSQSLTDLQPLKENDIGTSNEDTSKQSDQTDQSEAVISVSNNTSVSQAAGSVVTTDVSKYFQGLTVDDPFDFSKINATSEDHVHGAQIVASSRSSVDRQQKQLHDKSQTLGGVPDKSQVDVLNAFSPFSVKSNKSDSLVSSQLSSHQEQNIFDINDVTPGNKHIGTDSLLTQNIQQTMNPPFQAVNTCVGSVSGFQMVAAQNVNYIQPSVIPASAQFSPTTMEQISNGNKSVGTDSMLTKNIEQTTSQSYQATFTSGNVRPDVQAATSVSDQFGQDTPPVVPAAAFQQTPGQHMAGQYTATTDTDYLDILHPGPQGVNENEQHYLSQPWQQGHPSQGMTSQVQGIPLFIPSVYNYSTHPVRQPQIFTPAPQDFSSHMTYSSSPGSQFNDHRPNRTGSHESYAQDSAGLWSWVTNTDWAEGAQKIGKHIIEKTKHLFVSQHATDTVLTTLDPGMEEYLNPVINIAVASGEEPIVQGIRQGFRNVFGHSALKFEPVNHNQAPLPVGFASGIAAVYDKLNGLAQKQFNFQGGYIMVATEVFLTELEQHRWSAMFCLGIRDPANGIELRTFSQPIPLPYECATVAYSKSTEQELLSGYGITIDEAIRSCRPNSDTRDWCYAVSTVRLQSVIELAAQLLAFDYKRQLESTRHLEHQQVL